MIGLNPVPRFTDNSFFKTNFTLPYLDLTEFQLYCKHTAFIAQVMKQEAHSPTSFYLTVLRNYISSVAEIASSLFEEINFLFVSTNLFLQQISISKNLLEIIHETDVASSTPLFDRRHIRSSTECKEDLRSSRQTTFETWNKKPAKYF